MDSKKQESGSSLLQRQIEEVRSMIAGMQEHLKFLLAHAELLGRLSGSSVITGAPINTRYEAGRLEDYIIPILTERGPCSPEELYAEIAPGREKLRKRGRGYGLGMVRTSLSQLLNAETPRIRMLDDGRYDVVR